MGMVWTRCSGSLSWAWAWCATMGANMRLMTRNIACLFFIGDLQILMREPSARRRMMWPLRNSRSRLNGKCLGPDCSTYLDLALARMSAYLSVIAWTKSEWHGGSLRQLVRELLTVRRFV